MTQAVTLAGLGSTTPTIVSPTLTSPVLGTPVSGSLVNCTDVNYTGFKNRIINGNMAIDQRNAGASVTPSLAGTTYTVDRFAGVISQISKLTFQQVIDAPEGFKYSTKCTVASSYTSTSTDQFEYGTRIEGQNLIDFNYGIATAQTVTLSFWVKGSVAGTYSCAIYNAAGTQTYISTYAVTSTWVKQTITIPGSVTGTWNTDNTIGMYVSFDLGCGSNFQGASSGSWLATNSRRVSGSVSFVTQTAGATFYITGVQLEKGSIATSFDYRPYGTELALCQRYYWKTNVNMGFSQTVNVTGSGVIRTPVTMRASPTIDSGATFQVSGGSAGTVGLLNATGYASSPDGIVPYNSANNWTVNSGVQFIGAFTAEL